MNKNILTQVLSLALLVSVASVSAGGKQTWTEFAKEKAGNALANAKAVPGKARDAAVATPAAVKSGAGKTASAISYVVRPNDGSELKSFISDKDTRFANFSNAVVNKALKYSRTYKYGVNGAKYSAMAAVVAGAGYKLYHSEKVRNAAVSAKESVLAKYVALSAYIASLRA